MFRCDKVFVFGKMKFVLPTVLMISLVGAIFNLERNRRRPRRKWTKRWLSQRQKVSNLKLLNELKRNEPGDYKNYLRMDEKNFKYLLEKIRPRIERLNTHMRESVSAEERLSATLRYLATGNSYEDLKFLQQFPLNYWAKVIPETCVAIYEELKEEYLKFPKTEEEWKLIAQDFKDKWNFDTCCGAIDGKHIAIVKPPNSGSYYYNYKGRFSMAMAIVNANYEFIMVHSGINGRISDGGVLKGTTFYDYLLEKKLNFTSAATPPGTQYCLPYTFVGDDAFPLLENLMKPYAQKGLTREQRIFNYRLSRARRIVENAFGIMANRFRVLHTNISINVNLVDSVVLCCCVLHNFLRRRSPTKYSPTSAFDTENLETLQVISGDWRNSGATLLSLKRTPKAATTIAKEIRNQYKNYFNNEGRVPFQEKMAFA